MSSHNQAGIQQRIRLLQQIQAAHPETAIWFDESIAYLTSQKGGEGIAEQTAGNA